MNKTIIIENNIRIEFNWGKEPFYLKSVSISFYDGRENETIETDIRMKTIISDVRKYLLGKIDILPIDKLDLRELSHFAKKVLCELRNSVPAGKTVTYKELANLAGQPNAARAVGTVLRNNPFPLFFPCHRVIKSNGDIGLFQGSREGTSASTPKSPVNSLPYWRF